jgi:GMP synthase (glutamine-hydrolysing)
MKLLCIKHIDFEGPAAIAQWAHQNGHRLEIAPIYQDAQLPAPASFDALVIMGGPMNVYEDDMYPWLAKEKRYIRSAIASGKHVLGICLGAQLIAHALGAKIIAGMNKEIGWFPIQRAPECPSDLPMPEALNVLHWHGDTFEIPQGAKRIASSAACKNQGFVHHSRVLALQCHLEMTPESLALLAAACRSELIDAPHVQNVERLIGEPTESYVKMHDALFRILNEWLKN